MTSGTHNHPLGTAVGKAVPYLPLEPRTPSLKKWASPKLGVRWDSWCLLGVGGGVLGLQGRWLSASPALGRGVQPPGVTWQLLEKW